MVTPSTYQVSTNPLQQFTCRYARLFYMNGLLIHTFLTKIGTKMCSNELYSLSFSLIKVCVYNVWLKLRSVQNENKEQKRNENEIVHAHISRLAGVICFKFDMLIEGNLCRKFGLIQIPAVKV